MTILLVLYKLFLPSEIGLSPPFFTELSKNRSSNFSETSASVTLFSAYFSSQNQLRNFSKPYPECDPALSKVQCLQGENEEPQNDIQGLHLPIQCFHPLFSLALYQSLAIFQFLGNIFTTERGKEYRLLSQITKICILLLLIASYVTLGKLLNLSVPQFLVYSEDNYSRYLLDLC